MKTKLQKIKYWASVSVIGIVLGLGLQFVKAWVEPTTTPPGANIAAPLSSGATAQMKAGALQVNGFRNIGATILDGNVNVAGALFVNGGISSTNTLNMNSQKIFNVNSIDMNGGGIKFADGSVQTTAARYTTCFWTSSTQLRANPASGDYTLDCGANMVMKGIRFLGTGGGDHNFITNVSINCCSR